MFQETRGNELKVTYSRISGTWGNPQTKCSDNIFGFLNKRLIFSESSLHQATVSQLETVREEVKERDNSKGCIIGTGFTNDILTVKKLSDRINIIYATDLAASSQR